MSVSLRTYALAVVLSPSLLQTGQLTCGSGNSTLSLLEFEVEGQDQLSFDQSQRSYDVSITSNAAVLRAQSTDPEARVRYAWWAGETLLEAEEIGVGGGEVTLSVPLGQSTLRIKVTAPEGASRVYPIHIVRGDFPCTEQGIHDAIAAGGGPYTFACSGPTTVTTQAEIVIDNDVILDGLGNLTVDGGGNHRVFSVSPGVTAELRRFVVTGGHAESGGGILSQGFLTLANSFVSGNRAIGGGGVSVSGGAGIQTADLTLANSVVSGNRAEGGGGIVAHESLVHLIDSAVSGNTADPGAGGGFYTTESGVILTTSTVSGNTADGEFGWGGGIVITQAGYLRATNSTISENSAAFSCGAIAVDGYELTMTSSTVSGNSAAMYGTSICWGLLPSGTATFTNNVIEGECNVTGVGTSGSDSPVSGGGNIESPSNTCGLTDTTDLANVTPAQLNLGPLQDNGGPTLTQAPRPGSFAIDVIPLGNCVDGQGMPLATDQRGVSRPQGVACDVGAVEVAP